MTTYIKVAGELYPATINGKISDWVWDNRDSKSITLAMTHAEAEALLPDGTPWAIVQKTEVPVQNEDGTPKLDASGKQEVKEKETEWDNSDYSLSGDIVDHRDGTVTIKMGKPTDLEDAYEMLLGGDSK